MVFIQKEICFPLENAAARNSRSELQNILNDVFRKLRLSRALRRSLERGGAESVGLRRVSRTLLRRILEGFSPLTAGSIRAGALHLIASGFFPSKNQAGRRAQGVLPESAKLVNGDESPPERPERVRSHCFLG